jgi:hypothetical protein
VLDDTRRNDSENRHHPARERGSDVSDGDDGEAKIRWSVELLSRLFDELEKPNNLRIFCGGTDGGEGNKSGGVRQAEAFREMAPRVFGDIMEKNNWSKAVAGKKLKTKWDT